MHKKDLVDILQDESRDILERVNAVLALKNLEEGDFMDYIATLAQRFSDEKLHEIVRREILYAIERLNKKCDAEYDRNDERRAKGVPFNKRVVLFDQELIDWCKSYIHKLESDLHSFKVRPLHEWLDPVDVKFAKRRNEGMGFIVRINLNRCYSV